VGLAIAQAQAAGFQTLGRAETMSSTEVLARQAVALDGADAEARYSSLTHSGVAAITKALSPKLSEQWQ
jgi:hypothetical protein